MEGDDTAAGLDVVAIGIEVGAHPQIVDPELRTKRHTISDGLA